MSTNTPDGDGPSAYVPDADADATAVIEGFYGHLARALDLTAHDLSSMRARHAELVAANAHLVVDEPARHNVRMTLVLVTAYEHVAESLGHERTYAALHAAFTEPLAVAIRAGTTAMLDHAEDPFRVMVELARAREHEAFGAGFVFDHPVDDDTRFHADVRRCHYHDVLAVNGMPELTPVMCAFDKNWIDAIVPGRHGFRFERTTTIGLGGSHCPFHFVRGADDRP